MHLDPSRREVCLVEAIVMQGRIIADKVFAFLRIISRRTFHVEESVVAIQFIARSNTELHVSEPYVVVGHLGNVVSESRVEGTLAVLIIINVVESELIA